MHSSSAAELETHCEIDVDAVLHGRVWVLDGYHVRRLKVGAEGDIQRGTPVTCGILATHLKRRRGGSRGAMAVRSTACVYVSRKVPGQCGRRYTAGGSNWRGILATGVCAKVVRNRACVNVSCKVPGQCRRHICTHEREGGSRTAVRRTACVSLRGRY